MKTVQVHVKYAQEGDDNLNSSRNTPGAIDSQFYIGKRLPLPLLGSVNSHLAESGGLEQYIIRSPTLPNVRQSLDLHSVTEDDKAALAELEVTPRSPRERTQRTNSNEAPYEDLFLNVPKLGAMLNISKSKGKNYYENLQEASRKRIQALYYNKTSPRGPIDPNILQEGDERTTPREPVEPPAPQSKPIHFTSRPRPKSGNRTYRKPGPSEFVLSADNSFSLRDSPVNSTQYEAQGPTASHLPMQPNTQLIALPTQVLDSPMLSARDDVTAAHPSMFDTSLSATSQISFVKQMKAIPPPTFVSVCLPSVPVVPHSAQNSNASILTSTDLVKKQQVLPMISLAEANLAKQVESMLRDDTGARNERVRFVLPAKTTSRSGSGSNKEEQKTIPARQAYSAGSVGRPRPNATPVMLGEEERIQYQYRPGLAPSKSRERSRNGRSHLFSAGFKLNKEDQSPPKGRDTSPAQFLNQTLDDFMWHEGAPSVTKAEKKDCDARTTAARSSSPKHRIMVLAHQIAQKLDILQTPEEHYNPKQYDVPVSIMSASEHLQRLIEEEQGRLKQEQSKKNEVAEIPKVSLTLPVDMVEAMHKQMERYNMALNPHAAYKVHEAKSVLSHDTKNESVSKSLECDSIKRPEALGHEEETEDEDKAVTPGDDLVLRWRAFIGKPPYPIGAEGNHHAVKKGVESVEQVQPANQLLPVNWIDYLYDLPLGTSSGNDGDLKIIPIDRSSLADILAKPSMPSSSSPGPPQPPVSRPSPTTARVDPQARVVQLNLAVASHRLDNKSLKPRPLTADRFQRTRNRGDAKESLSRKDETDKIDFSMHALPVHMQTRPHTGKGRK